jgi:simple sugar transport system permease protein
MGADSRIFRVFSRTNETLFTLMLNYIALCIVQYLHYVLWRDPRPRAFRKSKPSGKCPFADSFRRAYRWIIAIVLLFDLYPDPQDEARL